VLDKLKTAAAASNQKQTINKLISKTPERNKTKKNQINVAFCNKIPLHLLYDATKYD
jgi:hypothetical protein